jgi:chemotaxis protein methyltransferase CheR
VNVWSAGCATGEEPYTLAMLADSIVANVQERVRFLATDICSTALAVAREGIFPKRALRAVPENFLQYVTPTDNRETRYAIRPDIQSLISYARLNLIGNWPMRGPMHVIFCRNVMMYFDSPAQRRLAARFSQLLAPGGYLFIGHSEALSMGSGLDYIQPAVYQKPEALR